MGIATFLEDQVNSADELVSLADSRLYVGKRGRPRPRGLAGFADIGLETGRSHLVISSIA